MLLINSKLKQFKNKSLILKVKNSDNIDRVLNIDLYELLSLLNRKRKKFLVTIIDGGEKFYFYIHKHKKTISIWSRNTIIVAAKFGLHFNLNKAKIGLSK